MCCECAPQAKQQPCIDFSLTPLHLEVLPHGEKDRAGHRIHRRGSDRELPGSRPSQDARGRQYSTGKELMFILTHTVSSNLMKCDFIFLCIFNTILNSYCISMSGCPVMNTNINKI